MSALKILSERKALPDEVTDIMQQAGISPEVPEPSQDVITPNVKQCNYCCGPIDRSAHMFQCRLCHSIGDLTTGIMTPPNSPYHEGYILLYLENGHRSLLPEGDLFSIAHFDGKRCVNE